MTPFSLRGRSFGLAGITLLAALAILSACGGGGGRSMIPSASSAGSGKSGAQPMEHVGFSFLVPKATTAAEKAFRREPLYISSGTASITVIANPGTSGAVTTTATLNLSGTNSAGTATCSAVTGGSQCTVDVDAPGGTDAFQATFYDSNGNALSTGEVTGQTISATGTNTVDLTFDGVPATITVTYVGATPLPMASATTIPLSVSVQDASGATILYPGPYAYPITLVSSSSSHLKLSATSISAPPSPGASPYALTATYDGANADQFTKGVPYITASVSPGNLYTTSGSTSPLPQPTIVPAIVPLISKITTLSGISGPSGFAAPYPYTVNVRGVAYDPQIGAIFVSDYGNSVINVFDAASGAHVATVGAQSSPAPGGTSAPMTDGSYSTATLCGTVGVTYDPNDHNVYFVDGGYNAVRYITPTSETAGTVTTLAGPPVAVPTGSPGGQNCMESGAKQTGYADGTGSAVYSRGNASGGPLFHGAYGLTFDPNNNDLYLADTSNSAIRQITTALSTGGCYTGIAQKAGCVETVAGNMTSLNAPDVAYTISAGHADGAGLNGTGSAATFDALEGIVYDSCDNDLYVADTGNNTIRQVTLGNGTTAASATGPAGSTSGVQVTTIAGTAGTTGSAAGSPSGSGTNATASFNKPTGIAFDPTSCDLYVADASNELIRRITTEDSYGGLAQAATVTVYMGSGTQGVVDGYGPGASPAGELSVPFMLVWINNATPFGPTLYEIDNNGKSLRALM